MACSVFAAPRAPYVPERPLAIRLEHGIKLVTKPLLPRGAAPRRLRFGLGRGVVMEVDFARDSRMWLGVYEHELAGHVRALCAAGSASFDIGAEGGFYALVFARLGGGRVLAVEANADTCVRLHRSVAVNPVLAPLIEVRQAQVVGHTDAARGQVSLDDLAYAPGGFVPDLVKLDVEGKERTTLRGAARLLSERKPHVIVETHSEDLDDACREILASHGYTVETVEPRRWLPEVRSASLNRWLVAPGTPRRP